jgi:hypothetical protein
MVDSELFRKFLAPRIFYGLFFKIMLGRHELKWLMERRKFEYERYGISRRPSRGDALKSVKWWFSKVIAKASIQLDYDVLPPKAFWKCIEGSFSNESLSKYRDTDTIVPIMTIGHVKRVHSSENIDHILSLLEDRLKDRLVYWTLADAIKYWGHKLEM